MASGTTLYPILRGKGLYIVEGTPLLYHKPSSTLIASDLHLGYEEAMARTGIFLPRLQLKRALDVFRRVVPHVKPRKIIIDGDIKHVYERALKQEVSESLRLVEELRNMGVNEVVLVRGNHDTFISGPLKKADVDVVEDYLDLGNGVMLAHGHRKVETDFEVLVMGHEHPALQLDLGGARVKYPVFLLVPSERGRLILVTPALGVYQTGNPLTLDRNSYLSPIIREEAVIGEARPFISDSSVGVLPMPRLADVLPQI